MGTRNEKFELSGINHLALVCKDMARTVGVLCGGFPQADLQAAGCIAIYRDPTDLLERLDDSPLAR